MIIEFTGLPGSGKTTTVKELMLHLENKGYVCVEPTRKKTTYRYLDYLRFDNLKLRYLIFLYSKKYVNLLDFIYFSNFFLDYYNYYRERILASKNTIVLVDQGLLQLLISIPFTQQISNDDALKKILHYINKRNVMFIIVFCLCDIDTVYKRIKQRGFSSRRIDSLDEISMADALNIQEQNFSLLYNCIKEECKSVLAIDSRESLANKVKSIIGFLGDVDSNC